MTLKERVYEVEKHPLGCPCRYGYLDIKDECPRYENGRLMSCHDCWNREFKEDIK